MESIIKRNNTLEHIEYDQIYQRLLDLCKELNINNVNCKKITNIVKESVKNQMKTSEIDILTSDISATMLNVHPDYNKLASGILISNLHKESKLDFYDLMLYFNKNNIITNDFINNISKHKQKILNTINYKRDYLIKYFGYKTLEKGYLLKCNNIMERPQDMFMRVSIGIHGNDIDLALETYQSMSMLYFIHASPTLFNAGCINNQLCSCFLLTIKDDSVEGIYESLKDTAIISKNSGGVGINIHCIRSRESQINNTGMSKGIVPILQLFNLTALYIDQGGKRKGAFAIYLEPWHSDIFYFLQIKKNRGNDDDKARDIFTGLWIPDYFMESIEKDDYWYLMCPNKSPNLDNVYGDEFKELYLKYVEEKKYTKKIKARDLWNEILNTQIETGVPYMLYKDACNKKSNQKNLGVIKCSNLCTEIIQYSSRNEIAVCNLASISLNKFVTCNAFDFENFKRIIRIIVNNLNKIIDINTYPLDAAKYSNLNNRPIGIGVQGLADTFLLLKYEFESDKAKELNKQIFETLYYTALDESCNIAKKNKKTYNTYINSPIFNGILQFDMWNVTPSELNNWDDLRKKIKEYGIYNSLLTAIMPTASTSQILGNNESTEPFTNNVYIRRVLAGEFQVINEYLIYDLININRWNASIRNQIINNNGSIQNLDLPDDIKKLYKTVWEISQKKILDLSIDRAPYIDQSQSQNIFINDITHNKLSSMHFYGWKHGLKTGMYYLRTKPKINQNKIYIEKECNEEICLSCQ